MMRWTLTIATVLLVAVWLASGWLSIVWSSQPSPSGRVWGGGITMGLVGGGVGDDMWPTGLSVEILRTGRVPWPYVEWTPSNKVIGVPIWILALLSGLLATGAWAQRWRMRRRPNACPTCGYDLTGLPRPEEMQPRKCPECGA